MFSACVQGNKNYIINHLDNLNSDYIETIGEYGHLDIIIFLHKRGYNMEHGLIGACRGSELTIVKYLLSVNTHIDEDIIYYICQGGSTQILEEIEKAGGKIPPSSFLTAVEKDSINIARIFYNRRFNINYRDNLNRCFNALHYACLNENVQMVRFLLDIGVEVVKDSDGKLPYEYTNIQEIRILFA